MTSSSLRHWILALSFVAITQLVGNVLLFNVIVVYPHGNELLPVQFKTKPVQFGSQNGNSSYRHARSINTQISSDQSMRADPYAKTTAHPIPLKNEFLDAQTTKTPRTRRTRRPHKPKGPATILTNPNVPTETTTSLKALFAEKEETGMLQNKNESFGKATKDWEDLQVENSTETRKSPLFERDWFQFINEMLIFTSTGLGMLAGYVPLSWLLHKKGARIVIGAMLFFSAVFVAVQMQMIKFGSGYVCILRFLQGLTCAPLMSFIGGNSAQWATLKEQLTFLTVSISAILFAPAFSWFFVYFVIDTEALFEYQLIHYILAGLTLLLSVFWLIFYRDYPNQHKWVNGVELNKIATGKIYNNRIMDRNVCPLLLKSVSNWALLIASFAYFSAFALVANFMPVYLYSVLNIQPNVKSSLTFLLAIFCHLLCAALNRLMRGCSYTIILRVFNTLGFVLSAICFISLAAWHPDFKFVNDLSTIFVIVLFPLGMSTLGFIYGSVIYGRYFTQRIVSVMQVPFALAMTLVPFLVVFMTVENELRYWRLIFLITGATLILTSIIFAFLISGQPASWSEDAWDPAISFKMKNLDCINRNEESGLLEKRYLDGKSGRFHDETNSLQMERAKDGARQIVAGGSAGLVEILLMHPLDVVKTRLQLGKSHYSGLGDVFKQTYVREGIRGFYKGLIPPVLAETPKRATKFFTFEQYKQLFVSDALPMWATLSLAGCCAGITEAFVTNPFEVVKVRMQTDRSALNETRLTTAAVAREIVRKHGMFGQGLYWGLGATLHRHGTWNTFYFGIYHSIKHLAPDEKSNPMGSVLGRIFLGFVAGTIASTANIPFDVAKSRIQALAPTDPKQRYRSTWQAINLVRKRRRRCCIVSWFSSESDATWTGRRNHALCIRRSLRMAEVEHLIGFN
ncbi:SLC (SoLute Carrier)-like protein [Aphelenchoides bicaudatus]|nr:SLC (SoLute Carrier)-like protein [Aphelenchoides bicaudatus]